MKTLPKPKYCEQNWLDMNPTDGGRICKQCDKTIVDFSKMAWREIETLQAKNNNRLCGMYHPKQLDNWGQDIPNNNTVLLKAVAITGLTMSVVSSLHGQTTTISDSIVIKGKITDEITAEELPFAKIFLKNSQVGAMTDSNGNFKLVLRDVPTTPFSDTLEVNYVGYKEKHLVFNDLRDLYNSDDNVNLEEGELTISLIPDSIEIIAFYVNKPTRGQRIKWKFKKWFGRKNKLLF